MELDTAAAMAPRTVRPRDEGATHVHQDAEVGDRCIWMSLSMERSFDLFRAEPWLDESVLNEDSAHEIITEENIIHLEMICDCDTRDQFIDTWLQV